jgi:hypothetical protein
MKHFPARWVLGGSAAALVIGVAVSFAPVRAASATEQFTKDTGKPCAACHESPTGGGKLTPYGERFKANGNKLPAE